MVVMISIAAAWNEVEKAISAKSGGFYQTINGGFANDFTVKRQERDEFCTGSCTHDWFMQDHEKDAECGKHPEI